MIDRLRALRLPRRSVLLFLVAIVLPCAVLAGLTVLMMTQQRELAEKRRADARRALSAEIRSELLSQLERLKLQALARGRSNLAPLSESDAIALVAPLENGRMRLPWEQAMSAASVDKGPFADAMRAGERAEQQPGRADEAIIAFKAAVAKAASRSQAASAHLALARALTAAGRIRDAVVEEQQLFQTPLDVRDEYGTPFALYGARRQLSRAADRRADVGAILQVLESCLTADRAVPVTALYTVRDLSRDIIARTSDEQTRRAAQRLIAAVTELSLDREQAILLQESLPILLPPAPPAGVADRPWAAFGPDDNRWLVSSIGAEAGQASTVVAVRWSAFRSHIESLSLLRDNGARLVVAGRSENAESLGGALPSLSLTLAAPEPATRAREETLQRRFYLVALLLVVGIAWFGGYFFWQDVQRDLRVAGMRSHFVASVSHELKTPLTSIRMFAETLLMRRSPNPQTQQEYLETIVNESERLTRLINNVLDFSKIEQGTKSYRLLPQSLGDIVRTSARVMEYPLLQEGFELRVNVDPDVPPAAVDGDAVQQAILNLLSNAMKYSAGARTIDLALSRSGDQARISVIDRGSGIPHAEQAKIFQKFYRTASSETQHIPGTGLGLTIVEHTAAAHGGHVEVRSAPGQGSTFTIVLPLAATEPVEHRPHRPLDSAHASHSGH